MFTTAHKYLYKISKINRQKVLWYKLSVFVLLGIASLIYGYDYIISTNLERWFLFAAMIVSAVWWYWTMGVLSTLLQIKTIQINMLEDILEIIKDIKKDVKDS